MILVGDMRLLPYLYYGDLLPGLSGSFTLVIQGHFLEGRRGFLEQENIALDHARHRVTRLTSGLRLRFRLWFLPTHCSHNVDRKRDL